MKMRPQKLVIILCKLDIKTSYITCRKSRSLDMELLRVGGKGRERGIGREEEGKVT